MSSTYRPYLQDYEFLRQVDETSLKEIVVKIIVLDQNERPLREIQGKVSSGTININSDSSLRRAGTLSFLPDKKEGNIADVNNIISLNKRVKIELGYINTFDRYTEFPVLWFPLGVYVIVDSSLSRSLSETSINIAIQDKMCLLNGTVEGTFPAAVTINQDIETNEYFPIYDVIRSLLLDFANESASNVIISDVPLKARMPKKWAGSKILYVDNNNRLVQASSTANSLSQTTPKVMYWWPRDYEMNDPNIFEHIAKSSGVVTQVHDQIVTIKETNPDSIALFGSTSEEVSYCPVGAVRYDLLMRSDPSWILTQAGTTLTTDIDAAQTVLPIANMTNSVTKNAVEKLYFNVGSNETTMAWQGDWGTVDANAITKAISTTGIMPNPTKAAAQLSNIAEYKTAIARYSSAPFTAVKTVDIDTLCVGMKASASINAYPRIFAYIMKSDNTLRSVVCDWTSTTALDNTEVGRLLEPTTTPQMASVGDHLVVEIGVSASATASQWLTIWLDGTNTTDLSAGADANLYPGWIRLNTMTQDTPIDCFRAGDIILCDSGTNTEMMFCESVDTNAKTITVLRGHRDENWDVIVDSRYAARAHLSGTRIAAVASGYEYALTMDCTTDCPRVDLGDGNGPQTWNDFIVRETAAVVNGRASDHSDTYWWKGDKWDGIWHDVMGGDRSNFIAAFSGIRSYDPTKTNTLPTDNYESFDLKWNAGMRAQASAMRIALGTKIFVGNDVIFDQYNTLNGNTWEEHFYSPSARNPTGITPSKWRRHFVGPNPPDATLKNWDAGINPRLNIVTFDYGWTSASGFAGARYCIGSALLGNAAIGMPTNNEHMEHIWFDEFDAELGYPIAPPYQINANMNDLLLEAGMIRPSNDLWTLSITSGAATKIIENNDYKITITKPGSTQYDIKLNSPTVDYSPGRYYLTFKAKASSRVTSLSASFGGVSGGGGKVTTEWREYSIPFTVTTSGTIPIKFSIGHVEGSIWFKDLTLIKPGKEIWRRDFTGGCVVVNAEESIETVQLNGTFKKLLGTHDPVVNDGSLVTQVSLAARDGIVLLHQHPFKSFQPNDIVGYEFTDFIIQEPIVIDYGQSIANALDKIVSILGNYEYFYDVEGRFIFREIKNYINKPLAAYAIEAINDIAYVEGSTRDTSVYDFNNSQLLLSINNNPQYSLIKNDFVVWGETPALSSNSNDKKSLIRFHLAIDQKPYVDNLIEDWRNVLYRQAKSVESSGLAMNPYGKELLVEWEKCYNPDTLQWKTDDFSTLPYFLDFIDTQGPLNELGVTNIGRRTRVVHNEKVNCLFLPYNPGQDYVLILDNTPDYDLIMNEIIINGYDENHIITIPENMKHLLETQETPWNDAYSLIKGMLYESARYNSSITLECIPIYYLDVNSRISVYDAESGINGDFLINSISVPLSVSENMNINASAVLERL